MISLRAAVIGLGVGEAHIAGYDAHPHCRTVAICDIDPARLSTMSTRHKALKATTDPSAILADDSIDIVSIASPDDVHHQQVVAALASGKHVFVEKPLCLLPKEAADIKESLARHPELRLGCNLILRSSPRFAGLRDLIRDGTLGEVYQVDGAYNYGRFWKITDGWRGAIPHYSVTLGGGIHLLDLMMWMLGKVSEVAAAGSRIAGRGSRVNFDDAVTALLRFENGAIGTLSSNFGCVYPHFHRFVVYGTKGTFENGRDAALLFTSREPDALPQRIETPYPGVRKGDLIANFVDAVMGTAKPLITHEEIFNCLSVGFAVEEALRTHRSIAVQYDAASDVAVPVQVR